MRLGAHESGAGGLHLAFERCARDHADAVQLWTRSSRQWAARPLSDEAIQSFRRAHSEFRQPKIPTAAHASYLINLATANDAVRARSIATLTQECERAEALGIAQVIVHPGAAVGTTLEDGLSLVAAGLSDVCHALDADAQVRLLVEITAGQGSCVGCSFEQLAEILTQADEPRLGVCLDTQHMWAAGIDWTTERGYAETFESFDRLLGNHRIEAFHLNDSKKPLGSRVDRHEVIGDGLIGLDAFRRLVTDERWGALPGYLETPPLANGDDSFAICLERLRSFS